MLKIPSKCPQVFSKETVVDFRYISGSQLQVFDTGLPGEHGWIISWEMWVAAL